MQQPADSADERRLDSIIRVFGGIGLDGADGPVSIGGPRQRRLLALLAIRSGLVVDIDWLAEYLWDDDDRPEITAPPLRTYVSRLRSSFPADLRDWIQTESEGYRLAAPPESVEHLRFARLRAKAANARDLEDPQTALRLLDEALSSWRGDPFRELEDLEWAAAEIERLRIDRLEAMEERWEAALALGRHTQITGELAAFTMEHGDRDRAVRQHALALHRSGRTADALKVINRHKKALGEEYGLDPSPEVLELEEALIKGDPALDVETEGRPLRGYRLIDEIGVGAFAVVWRGVQPSVDREVAIKQIRAELASQPEFIRRFEAEAHLIAQIEHPHIVPLIDYWRDPDSAYLVMRWLRGGTLERRLDDGPLGLDDALTMASQIGGALEAAHSRGVIHRDVKTANILFDEHGNAFLTDFGIALEASRSSGPEAALSPGSPAYSAPEQIRQEPLGPQADVFSLGVVLYESLAGSLPFADVRSAEELVGRQLDEPYPALHELRPDVPVAVSDAIARATAKSADDRFVDISAFVAALTIADSGPTEAATPSDMDRSTLIPRDISNPYLGLRAFDDVDATRFFGRERLVSELIARLSGSGLASRCLVVVGPSGSGKSSVVRAGLVPSVREGSVPGSDEWFVTTMVPGVRPYESLEIALLRVAVNPPGSLLDQLQDGPRGILRGVRRCLPSDDTRVLLVIDQFEEVFTAGRVDEASAFLDALAVAVDDPAAQLRLVVTLRADYYDRPLEHPGFAPVLDATTVNVTPLAGDELERAIVKPARACGVTFEPGLVARIAAETMGQPSPLPLLQYTLAESFDRRDGDTITIARYEELGGLSGALAARADAIYVEADDDQQAAVRRVFGGLTNPGEEVADIRRRVNVADLGTDPDTAWVLKRYGDARLLTFDRDAATREPTVEVAHEALLRSWPRLVEWLAEDAELLRGATALADASNRWVEGGREPGDLLRDGRLGRAQELVAVESGRLRAVDLEFVAASQEAADSLSEAEQRGKRRQGLLAAGVGVAIVVAVVFGSLAFLQLSRADDEADTAAAAAERADLATLLSGSVETDDPKVAILLALEAQRRAPGPDTDRALISAIRRSGGGRTVASFPALVEGACGGQVPGWISLDGMSQVSSVDGIAARRDLTDGTITEHGELPGEDCQEWMADPSGSRRLALSGSRSQLWLGASDGPWGDSQPLDGDTYVAGPRAFGATRFLLTSQGSVRLIDSISGRPVGGVAAGLGPEAVSALAPDDSRFAVARPADQGQGSPASVAVHDGADGHELYRQTLPGTALKLHFDPVAGHLLVATAERRLYSLDVADGSIVAEVGYIGDDLYSLGVRPDGAVVLVSRGSPGLIETVDRYGGPPPDDAIEVDNMFGGYLRDDGQVVVWDPEFRIDILDPGGQPLVLRSLDLPASPERTIEIMDGRVFVHDSATLSSTATDLVSGESEALELRTDSGQLFPATQEPFPIPGGHGAVSDRMDIAIWRDASLVDSTNVASVAGAELDGVAFNGRFVALGGSHPDHDAEIHLLDVGGDRIEERYLVRPGGVTTARPTRDGGLVVLGEDGVLRVWDPLGEPVTEVDFQVSVSGPSSLHEDQKVALVHPGGASGASRIEIVDISDGSSQDLRTFSHVANIKFVRDGQLLLVKDNDGTVRVRDLETGAQGGVLWTDSDTLDTEPWYDPDTDTVWFAGAGGLVQIPLARDDWRALACERAGRELTTEEWADWVSETEPQVLHCAS